MNQGIDSSPHLRYTLQTTTAESNMSCFFGFSTRSHLRIHQLMGSLVKTTKSMKQQKFEISEITRFCFGSTFRNQRCGGTVKDFDMFFLRCLFFDVESSSNTDPINKQKQILKTLVVSSLFRRRWNTCLKCQWWSWWWKHEFKYCLLNMLQCGWKMSLQR